MAPLDPVAVAARETLRAAVADAPRGTQSQIARALSVSRQTVSGWLSGDLPIHPRWFLRLEDVLSREQFEFAEATGLYEALNLDSLDYDKQVERWEMVFGSVDPDSLPPRRETRKYKPSAEARDIEARLTSVEERLAAMGGLPEDDQPEEARPAPDPAPEGP